MKLTFEQTQGTRTFYFPLDRDKVTPPEFTVVIRPLNGEDFDFDPNEDQYEAGVAFCSKDDQFSKRRGRLLAYHRMFGKNAFVGTSTEIAHAIEAKLDLLVSRRPFSFSAPAIQDVLHVIAADALAGYFKAKKENREAAANA